MRPIIFLLLMLGLTVWALALGEAQRRRRHRQARRLAREWEMLFSETDTLALAARVAPSLPVPGAAEVVVHDLIYGSSGTERVYIFSAVYTQGVLGTKRRVRRVVKVLESSSDMKRPIVTLADASLAWIEQYRQVKNGA